MDKGADTGRFELVYKQTQVAVPPYIGINLIVEGQTVRRPPWLSPKKSGGGGGEESSSGTKIGLTPRPPSLFPSTNPLSKSTDKSSSNSKNSEKTLQPTMPRLQLTTINLHSKSSNSGGAVGAAGASSGEGSTSISTTTKSKTTASSVTSSAVGATSVATSVGNVGKNSNNGGGGGGCSVGSASSGVGTFNVEPNPPLKTLDPNAVTAETRLMLSRQSEPKSLLSKSTSHGQMQVTKLAMLDKEDLAARSNTLPVTQMGSIDLKEFHKEMVRGNHNNTTYHRWVPNSKSDPLFPLRRFRRPPIHKKVNNSRKLGSVDMPVGIQLPEQPHVNLIRVPQVPYLNLSIAYRLSRQEAPRSKLKATKTIQKISSVNAELEKLHKMSAV